MSITRRALLATTLASPILASPALAQSPWPNRTVRIILPFPPGGGTDTLARLLAQHLQTALSQSFVVENRAGGSGIVGTEQLARATPDGYTLAVNSSGPLTILPHLQSVPYDPIGSFEHVILPALTPLLLVVPAASPIRTLAEALERTRARRGGLNMCNIGVGSPSHLVSEMFTRAFGIDMTHVPHRGSGPALQDAVAGQCDLLFDSATSSLALVRQGLLRALAMTGAQRMESLPDTPTMIESGAPAIEASTWSAMFAPAGTPAEIVDRLNRECRAFMRTPAQVQRLRELGSIATDFSPAEFRAFMVRESASWGSVIRSANIRL